MRHAAGIVCCVIAVLGPSGAAARVQQAASPGFPTSVPTAPWIASAQTLPPRDESGPSQWFYQGLPYGSESLVHPLRLIFNGGFGALQFENRSNRLGDVRFGRGWHRLWADLHSPIRTIRLDGWNEFLATEVIPVSVNRESAQYWPNYTLHLIGGGMSSVMMREWYEQHGFRHAGLAANATLTAYHLLNEVVEAADRNAPSTDAIADLLLFDPVGVWLFSHDGVDGFFSRRLHLRDWSSQPAIDPTTGAVENHGQNFSIKLALPRTERWSLFYYFGNHGEAGLSYRLPDGSAFSAGAGTCATSLVDLGRGRQTADLLPSAGFFYDRNGSLLFSVTTAKNSRYGVRVNAYPGMVRVHGWTAGLFVLYARNGDTVTGVQFAQFPVGLAGHR